MLIDAPPPLKFWLPPKPAIIRSAPDLIRPATLPGFMPIGSPVAAAAGKVLTYRNYYLDASNNSTYTFTATDVGSAEATRRVIVGAHQYGGSVTLTSATIGGVSATEVTTDSANTAQTLLLIAHVPTGTTADVVLTWSGSTSGSAVSVWTATGLSSDTAVDSGRSATNPATDTISTVDGGFIIGVFTINGNGVLSTTTWSGVAEDFDVQLESNASISGGSATTNGSNVSISATPSGLTTSRVGAFASW